MPFILHAQDPRRTIGLILEIADPGQVPSTGFSTCLQAGKSTETALHSLVTKIAHSIQEKHFIPGVYGI